MKSSEQTTSALKAQTKAAKTRGGKSMPFKATKSAKKSASAAKRGPSQARPTFGGYSDSAARLIARGKSAFGDAYAWAGEVGGTLPKTARQMSLANSNSLKNAIEDKPLILGAAGLGIGVIIGSMLPSAFSAGAEKRLRRSRRK
jgi:hypothetical protein